MRGLSLKRVVGIATIAGAAAAILVVPSALRSKSNAGRHVNVGIENNSGNDVTNVNVAGGNSGVIVVNQPSSTAVPVESVVKASTLRKNSEGYQAAFRSVEVATSAVLKSDLSEGVGVSGTFSILLTLQSSAERAVSVSEIKIVMDDTASPIDAAIAWYVPAGSDPLKRWALSLDESTPVVRDMPEAGTNKMGKPAFEGNTVTLNPFESWTVALVPLTKACYCRFHLTLTLVVDGSPTTKDVFDASGAPFEVSAGASLYQEGLFVGPGSVWLRCSSPEVRSPFCGGVVAGKSSDPIVSFPGFAAKPVTVEVCDYGKPEAAVIQSVIESFGTLKPGLPLPDIFGVDTATNTLEVGVTTKSGYLLMRFVNGLLVKEVQTKAISIPFVARVVPFYYAGERGLSMRSCDLKT